MDPTAKTPPPQEQKPNTTLFEVAGYYQAISDMSKCETLRLTIERRKPLKSDDFTFSAYLAFGEEPETEKINVQLMPFGFPDGSSTFIAADMDRKRDAPLTVHEKDICRKLQIPEKYLEDSFTGEEVEQEKEAETEEEEEEEEGERMQKEEI